MVEYWGSEVLEILHLSCNLFVLLGKGVMVKGKRGLTTNNQQPTTNNQQTIIESFSSRVNEPEER